LALWQACLLRIVLAVVLIALAVNLLPPVSQLLGGYLADTLTEGLRVTPSPSGR
jgi:hypothetical protein